MTLEQINALTLENVPVDVIARLLTGEYTIEVDEAIENGFDRILVIDAVKPTREEAEAEFLIYKQELLDEENARLAEVARMADINSRLDALTDSRAAHYSINPDVPNAAAWIRDNILKADAVTAEANLAALESADAEQKAQRDAVAYVEKRKAEYPSIEELIVAMWEGDQTKIDELEAVRQAIKTKYPKP